MSLFGRMMNCFTVMRVLLLLSFMVMFIVAKNVNKFKTFGQ